MNRENGTVTNLQKLELTLSDFERVRQIIYDYCGINLNEGKQALVRARLMKRIRILGIPSFQSYLDYIEGEGAKTEFLSFVDVLTTNKTSFFRENQHFDFINDEIIPQINGRSVKWWSAGCSSGEEPVTMAISLMETLNKKRINSVKILGTDISRDVVQIAKNGFYPKDRMKDVPDYIKRQYFSRIEQPEKGYETIPSIKEMITYGRLNLKENWPLKGPFHVIMCRNVMIYFDRETQKKLISRFYDLLEHGGYLFLGHSESVVGKDHGFVNLRPAVYQKRGG